MPQKKSHNAKTSKKANLSKRRELVLLDTGPIVGLFNSNDEWHERCKEFFGQTDHLDYTLTQAVLCEVIFHIQQAKDPSAAAAAVVNFLEMIENGNLKLHKEDSHYITRLKELRQKYSDKKVDIADLSLVLAAEDLQLGKIVTIDQRDFGYLTFRKRGKKRSDSGFEVVLPKFEQA